MLCSFPINQTELSGSVRFFRKPNRIFGYFSVLKNRPKPTLTNPKFSFKNQTDFYFSTVLILWFSDQFGFFSDRFDFGSVWPGFGRFSFGSVYFRLSKPSKPNRNPTDRNNNAAKTKSAIIFPLSQIITQYSS